MKFDNKMILGKMQPDPDVDPVPDGSNAVVSENLEWTPYAGNRITKRKDRGFFGANKEINAVPHVEFGFEVEFAQASAAGTPPAFGPWLRACGFSEVIDVGDVTYAPVSESFEEIAVYFLDDEEVEQKALNCKGSFSIQLNAEDLPKIIFSNFMGTYNKPTAAGAYTIDTSAYEESVPVTSGNTTALTVDGYAGCVNSIKFDGNIEVNYHDEPNCKGTSIDDREVTGEIVIKAPTIAEKDFFALVESHIGAVNTVPISATHGDGTRPDITINAPYVQLIDINRTKVRGELYYTISFKALPSDAGNDELELIF